MSDELEFEQTLQRNQVATALRALADGIAAGELRFDGSEHTATVANRITLEIEFEIEEDLRSVEVELEWPDSVDERPDRDHDATLDPTPVGPATPPESAARFEVFLDQADEWRWRLVHRNGNVIATSGEGYTRKHNAVKGLQSVVRNSPLADIVEE